MSLEKDIWICVLIEADLSYQKKMQVFHKIALIMRSMVYKHARIKNRGFIFPILKPIETSEREVTTIEQTAVCCIVNFLFLI